MSGGRGGPTGRGLSNTAEGDTQPREVPSPYRTETFAPIITQSLNIRRPVKLAQKTRTNHLVLAEGGGGTALGKWY